nr:MAG TPA: hypothetical protein [Caudoviricetes sp.]
MVLMRYNYVFSNIALENIIRLPRTHNYIPIFNFV